MITVFIPLTGGLGNQLFQLTAAMSINPDKVILSTRYGRPRRDKNNSVEIANWKLPDIVEIEDKKEANFIVRKTVGYLLRSGIAPSGVENQKIWSIVTIFIARIVLSLDRKQLVGITRSNDVGYYAINRTKARSRFLIGYFQSYKYSIENSLRFLGTEAERLDPLVYELYKESRKTDPICMHVRLGDYLSSDLFGTPSPEYYLRAAKELGADDMNLWIFSDDVEMAKLKLSALNAKSIRWFDKVSESDSKTLQTMSFCRRFVLSNSTFGWWAARLSSMDNKKVICPKPWFADMPEPLDLIPIEWKRRDANFS